MLRGPSRAGGQEFGFRCSNIAGVVPAAAMGVTVTPAQNAKGSYTEVLSGATVARDLYFLRVNFNSSFVATNARDAIVDIGVDPNGGTSYSVLIPDLLASCADGVNIAGGVNYYFPIFVRAGSSIAARASVNNATVGTIRCFIQGFGFPRDQRRIKCGSYVRAFGIDTATSAGTAVTPGGASEGSWTQLGSAIAAGDRLWWWQLGMGINNTVVNQRIYHADLGVGDASNKRIVIEDQYIQTNTNEQLFTGGTAYGCEFAAPAGALVYGRLQRGSTADTGVSMAAWAVGG